MYVLFLQKFIGPHHPGGDDQGIASSSGDDHVLYIKTTPLDL